MTTALDKLIADVNKKVGSTVLIRGSQLRTREILRVSTGSLAFDLMLGGGWPLNCWSEIIGNESHGKTVMALKTIAANQAANPAYETLWVASENFNWEWAATLGVDLDRIALAETQNMEEAYQIMVDALQSRAADAIILDSYPALIPSDEAEKSMMDLTIGAGARVTGQFMRKSGAAGRRHLVETDRPCLGIIINQWRDRIGVMYGDPRTTPGGKAKNFSYHTRVEVSRADWIESGDEKVGLAIKARTLKNKTAPPQRTGQVDFYFEDAPPAYRKGNYDTVKEMAAIALSLEIVERKGSYYRYGEQQWQGKEQFFQAIREEPVLQRELDKLVRSVVLDGKPFPTVAERRPGPTEAPHPPRRPRTRG